MEDVTVVAVTKSVSAEAAAALFGLGCTSLGESRPQELERKAGWFEAHGLVPHWHFIGPLQRNKARKVVRIADTIHSVDSARLFDTLERVALEEQRFPSLFLEVKLSDEPTKTGFSPDEVRSLLDERPPGRLPILGLMGIAPRLEGAPPEEIQRAAAETFERLASLAETLPRSRFQPGGPRLSMGMSRDFELAIRAGADFVRIGSAFFEGVDLASMAPSPESST